MLDVVSPEHVDAARSMRELLAVYRDHEDLISIGAYRQGTNRDVDLAIEMKDKINEFLRQPVDEPSTVERARESLFRLARHARDCRARPGGAARAVA
jgi:flagellum-specific ATP synthase